MQNVGGGRNGRFRSEEGCEAEGEEERNSGRRTAASAAASDGAKLSAVDAGCNQKFSFMTAVAAFCSREEVEQPHRNPGIGEKVKERVP